MDSGPQGPECDQRSPAQAASAVDVSEDEVHAAHDRDHVRDQHVLHQPPQRLEIAEGGWPDLHPVGLVGAVRDEVETELAARALDEAVNVADRPFEAFTDEPEVMDDRLHTLAELAS